MALKDRIRMRREHLGMTQEQLAEKIGVGKSAVSNYEVGLSTPKTEIMYKLFEALETDPNFLFQEEYEKETKKTPETTKSDIERTDEELKESILRKAEQLSPEKLELFGKLVHRILRSSPEDMEKLTKILDIIESQ